MNGGDIFRKESFSSPSRGSINKKCSLSAPVLESLADRFPFSEKELEQLVGCYETKFKDQHVLPLSDIMGPVKSFEDDILCNEEEAAHKEDTRASFYNLGGTRILMSQSFDTGHLPSRNGTNGAFEFAPVEPEETILVKLASSADVLFSMDDTLRRVRLVQEKVLPWRFTDTLGKFLLESIYISCYGLEGVDEALLVFLENLAVCMGRRGPRQVVDIIFDSCVYNKDKNEAMAMELIRICYYLAVSSHLLSEASTSVSVLSLTAALEEELEPPHQLLVSLVTYVKKASTTEGGDRSAFQFEQQESVFDTETDATTHVTRAQFREWVDSTAPVLASVLPTFLHDLLFLGKPFPKSGMTPFRLPDIRQPSLCFTRSPRLRISTLSFCFSTVAPEFCKRFHQLYSLEANGSSFTMLCKALIGYDGPVVVIASAEGGGIFGAYSSTKWKSSGEYYGGYESFLFRIDPCLNIYRPTGNKTHFTYLNPSTRLKCDGKVHGLGFGGTHYAPRLFIPESFDDDYCRAGSFDTTYEQGPLLPGDWQLADRFKLRNLEVWGVGDPSVVEAALMAQEQKRRDDDVSLRRAQLVDKRAFVDDLYAFSDKPMFAHRQQARGRTEYRVNDDDGHTGYSIDRDAKDRRTSIMDIQNTGLLDDLPSKSPSRSAGFKSAFD